MAAEVQDNPIHPSPAIRRTLGFLRESIRWYVGSDGLLALLLWAGLGFWTTLAVDWVFEPPAWVRVTMLAGVAAWLLVVFFRLVVRRLTAPLSDTSMAILLERRYPQFHESLLTSVDLSARPGDLEETPWRRQMLRRTIGQAEGHISGVSLGAIFNLAPLRNRLIALFVVLAATIGLAALAGEYVSVWFRRNVLLSEELWPRNSRIVLDGFADKTLKVARGSDVELLVKADTQMPVVPPTVEVRYRVEGGSRAVAVMTRLGVADRKRDAYQEYSYTFRGLLYPVDFDIRGGDAALRGYRIQVVDSPTFVQGTMIELELPAYTGRKPRAIPFSAAAQVLKGSRVTVAARTNKPLVRVQVDTLVDDKPGAQEVLAVDPKSDDRNAFRYTLPNLDRDKTLLFTLFDADGIRGREPVRLSLAAIPDEAPRLALQLRGIGTAITARARLPVIGRITDDYGLDRAWGELGVEQRATVAQPIAIPGDRPAEVDLAAALDVEPLGLKPGVKLLACVRAQDHCNLGPQPNIGTSERWLLDVVTPEQLRTMLEGRELILRQRFEAIIQELTDGRELLVRIDFRAGPGQSPRDSGSGEKSIPSGDKRPPISADLADRLVNQIESVLQQVRKNAHETQSLADSFDDIRLQFKNNRIDTEELNRRLQGKIAEPLGRIASGQFPDLERRLDRLRDSVSQPARATEIRRDALRRLDEILLAMKEVLQQMHALETFNELVEQLRTLIQEQEKVNQDTKQLHKNKLRDLLKE